MAIQQGTQFSVKLEDAQKKVTRRKAGDRPEFPPETGLRASRYGIADRLNEHFMLARNNAEYGLEWAEFLARAQQDYSIDALKLARKRAKMKGEARTLRVRASELKNCARATAMDLMGFEREEVGENSPHWN